MFFIRRFCSSKSLLEAPAILQIRTWPPGIKHKDSSGKVIAVEPMNSLSAKRAFLGFNASHRGSSLRMDPLGHASALLTINIRHGDTPRTLIHTIESQLKKGNVNPATINSLEAYVSWFPTAPTAHNTRRTVQLEEELRLLGMINPEDKALMEGKKRLLQFCRDEQEGENSALPYDEHQYGIPSPERIISLTDLDFDKITQECFMMLKGKPVNNQFPMDELHEDATYFGIHMLRTHEPILSQNIEQTDPMHVCTTAVLRLLEAGVGSKTYKEILASVFNNHPDLSHGFPIVDLTDQVAKEIRLRSEVNLPANKPKAP